MESSFSKLKINQPPKKRLASNVYNVRTNDDCVVHRYVMSLERLVTSSKGTKCTIKTNGPDCQQLIRSRVSRAALLVITSSQEYRATTIVYDNHDTLYANKPLTVMTKEIQVSSLDLSDDDRRIILKDSVTISVSIKADGGLRNLQSSIRACDRDDPNLINFYACLVKSAAPHDRFFGLRGGRLFDIMTLEKLGASGMERAKGVKIGSKLIGDELLSIAIDIDSKEGTFYTAQKLENFIMCYFNWTKATMHDKFHDMRAMRSMEKLIRDIPVREEVTDRIFTVSGLKWEWREEVRSLQNWLEVCPNEEHMRYGCVPVVVEEYPNKDPKGRPVQYNHALTALYFLQFTKVPLVKQDKINRPKALAPDVRHKLIDKARTDILIDHQNDFLKGFETNIATSPVLPSSEILPAPTISAVKNGQISRLDVHTTKHNYNSNPFQFVVPAQITCFHVIYDLREIGMKDEAKARKFFEALCQVCTMKGVKANEAKYFAVDDEPGLGKKLKWLKEAREREAETRNGVAPTVIVIAIGFKDEHDYIKDLEHEWKVVTQHVMRDTLERVLKKGGFATDKTLHNIVKKINEKCGGTNLEVTGPIECASLFPTRTGPNSSVSLIIGMDVCHGDPISKHLENRGVKPDPSIIGIASNALTANPQMYTGDLIPTEGRRESVPDRVMSDHGKYLMEKFLKNHGKLPDNVILVRDGVSRSQYDMAVGEFNALMEGVRSAVESTVFNPRELLIIVTKDHNLRLFDKVDNKVCNPRPGTVVDSEIVSPFMPEFLIIPHDAFSGTAKGILVTVLKDGEKDLRKFPSDSLNEIKFFIHSLCYLQGICDNPSGSPAPVSVSHDLAERGMNLAKQWKFRTRSDERLDVKSLEKKLMARGTSFEGLKFTA